MIHTHLGGPSSSSPPPAPRIPDGGWLHNPPTGYHRAQREFPDNGNGDFSQPAIRIRHAAGTTVTRFVYDSYEIVEGKKGLNSLPATTGGEMAASTLLIHLRDTVAQLEATLSYSVFPAYNAFVRSFELVNDGDQDVTIEAAASFSVDLGNSVQGLEMIQLSGEWAREAQIIRRTVSPGIQGYGPRTVKIQSVYLTTDIIRQLSVSHWLFGSPSQPFPCCSRSCNNGRSWKCPGIQFDLLWLLCGIRRTWTERYFQSPHWTESLAAQLASGAGSDIPDTRSRGRLFRPRSWDHVSLFPSILPQSSVTLAVDTERPAGPDQQLGSNLL